MSHKIGCTRALAAALALCWAINSIQTTLAITFTTIDDPLAGGGSWQGTHLCGIEGGNIVGCYSDSLNWFHSFVYDGSTFTELNGPPGTVESQAFGISGGKIVGQYETPANHGFVYDGSTYTTVDDPFGAVGTQAQGISGNNVVGYYQDSQYVVHGFLFNGSTYTTVDHPMARTYAPASGTFARGIDGNKIVGYYDDNSYMTHGFLYDGSTYQTLDATLATTGTFACGIQGNNIVGYYQASFQNHGFLYDGSTYTTIDYPSAINTVVFGIDGDTVVGAYSDSADVFHGFMATIPEPSTLALLAAGGVGLLAYFWRRLASV